jgi:tetratricopeptide (TPR) repeat protein
MVMANLDGLVRRLLAGVVGGWSYEEVQGWLREMAVTEELLVERLRVLAGEEDLRESLAAMVVWERGELAAVARELLVGEGVIELDYQELVDRADQFFAEELYTEAIEYYRLAIKIKEDDYNSWKQIGRSFLYENNEEALKSFDELIELNPEYHEAWNGRGNALNDMGRYKDALESYDRVIKLNPEYHNGWFNSGIALCNMGQYEEALERYNRAIKLNPESHDAWNSRGNSLYNMGRYEEALESYDRVIKLNPEYHDAWNSRGNALNLDSAKFS